MHTYHQRYLKELTAKFGEGSTRVARLRGLLLEARGKYDDAVAVYDGILAKEPTNVVRVLGTRREGLGRRKRGLE